VFQNKFYNEKCQPNFSAVKTLFDLFDLTPRYFGAMCRINPLKTLTFYLFKM